MLYIIWGSGFWAYSSLPPWFSCFHKNNSIMCHKSLQVYDKQNLFISHTGAVASQLF